MLEEVLGDEVLFHKNLNLLKTQVASFGREVYRQQLSQLQKNLQVEDFFTEIPIEKPSCKTALKKPFGVIILAGGQGTRLGSIEPKGCFELSHGHSLFSILCKKLQSIDCSLAVMTSLQTDVQTKEFFHKNQFFGLKEGSVDFFMQQSWPILTQEKKWAIDENGDLMLAPKGNGCVYQALLESPIFEKWKNLNIHAVNFLPVDNFLADPKDDELIALIENGADLAVRAIERNLDEKIGMMVLKNNRLAVVEYTELGNFNFSYGYSGLFATSLDFIQKAGKVQLPEHLALKKAKVFKNGVMTELKIIKFEHFIFDAFFLAEHFKVLNSCRKKYFCPLKDKLGPFGIDSVKEQFLDWMKTL